MRLSKLFSSLLIALLLMMLAVSYIWAQEPDTTPAANLNRQLSTADLIEQAFANGEITAEQRLLYFAYAVYEPESLPTHFHGTGLWSPTPYLREIHNARRAAGELSAMSATFLAELESILPQATDTVCDKTDGPDNTESVNFRINYDASKLQTSPTITDIKDALDLTFTTLITTYGMPKPPFCTDNDDNGDCTDGGDTTTNPWGKYPIQLSDALSSGVLAYVTTNQGSKYVGFVGDNPNTGATETDSYASCMVLGYDYSGGGDPKGLMEGTVAHEYFHAVQNAYGDTDPEDDAMWFESTAAYIEDEVYDSTNTQYEYLNPLFDECLGQYEKTGDDNATYRNWMLFRYAAEHNGGANSSGGGSGKEIIEDFFRNLGNNQDAIPAYDNALRNKGTTLPETFHNFAIASRFMKTCPTASPFCYEEAAAYTTYAQNNGIAAITNTATIAAIGQSYSGSIKDHYAINWVGLPTTGPYTITLKGLTGGKGVFKATIVADTGGNLVTSTMDIITGTQTATIANYTPSVGATSVVAVITNQQETSNNPASCVANPYQLKVFVADVQQNVYLPIIVK